MERESFAGELKIILVIRPNFNQLHSFFSPNAKFIEDTSYFYFNNYYQFCCTKVKFECHPGGLSNFYKYIYYMFNFYYIQSCICGLVEYI